MILSKQVNPALIKYLIDVYESYNVGFSSMKSSQGWTNVWKPLDQMYAKFSFSFQILWLFYFSRRRAVCHWLGQPLLTKGRAILARGSLLCYWMQQDLDAGAPPPGPRFPPGWFPAAAAGRQAREHTRWEEAAEGFPFALIWTKSCKFKGFQRPTDKVHVQKASQV